jgi:serine/threonine-protein kinase
VDERGRPLSVVHRDVSPQNVIIGVDGVARILDFGVAKAAVQRHVTEQGEIKGKLAYMPPEQQFGELVDRRSDVYAAGVVLWEMLVGRRLFTAPDEDELVRLVFEMEVPAPSVVAGHPVPRELDHVVLRALAKRREERWWSAEQMASALSDALRPAAPAEVASILTTIAGREIEQRRRHVRELQGKQSLPLEREAQTVLEVLTARGADKLPGPSAFSPPTKVETPLARESARRRSSPDARASRRAERRARRQRRLVFTLAGVVLLVLFLMAIALFLGRRAREAELEDPASSTAFPPPPPLPGAEEASEPPPPPPGLTLDAAAIPWPGPGAPTSTLPRSGRGPRR